MKEVDVMTTIQSVRIAYDGVGAGDPAVMLLPESERKMMAGFAQVLDTDDWREALLGFFGSLAGDAVDRVRADIAAAPRVYAAPMMRDIGSSDFADDLAAVRCPVMYIHARVPLDIDRLQLLRPDAIVETIPNAG